jgi:hypothetical protein
MVLNLAVGNAEVSKPESPNEFAIEAFQELAHRTPWKQRLNGAGHARQR